MKLEVPATVNTPVSVIAPAELTFSEPVVVTSTPKSTPPVPAFRVKLPNPDETAVAKLTALPVRVAFNVNGVDMEVKPPTVMVPFELFPTVRLAAVNWPNSLLVTEKLPAPEPNPIVRPACAVRRVVPAVPDVMELPAPSTILFDVIDKELLVVDRVLLAASVKSPLALASLSELKLVVPFVVRLDESVIPLLAFTAKT